MGSQKPILPDVLPARDDELLSSWFTRIARANQHSTWTWFTNDVGYNGTRWSRTDMAAPEERFVHLLGRMGLTYEEVSRENTTLPFWLVFEFSSSDAPDKLSKKVFHDGSESAKLRFRNSCLWFCPQCVEIDGQRTEAHWRRAHQLPIAIVCHLHGCLLRSSCHFCGVTVSVNSNQLATLPKKQCKCGNSLLAHGDEHIPSKARLQALAAFGADALKSELDPWSARHVRDLAFQFELEHKRKKGDSSIGRSRHANWSFMQGISEYFDLENVLEGAANPALTPTRLSKPIIKLRQKPSAWRAVELSCIFVAQDMAFADFQQEVRRRISAGAPPVRSSRTTAAEKLAYAKQILFEVNARGKQVWNWNHDSPYNFWYVFFHDRAWLDARLLGSMDWSAILPPVPTIAEDRATVLQRRSGNPVRRYIQAHARAIARDADWLKTIQKKQMKPPRTVEPVTVERLSWLRKCLHKLIMEPGRPNWVTLSALANYCAMTPYTLRRLVKLYPAFEQEIAEYNSTILEKRVRWLVSTWRDEGKPRDFAELKRPLSLFRTEQKVTAMLMLADEPDLAGWVLGLDELLASDAFKPWIALISQRKQDAVAASPP